MDGQLAESDSGYDNDDDGDGDNDDDNYDESIEFVFDRWRTGWIPFSRTNLLFSAKLFFPNLPASEYASTKMQVTNHGAEMKDYLSK